MLYPQFTRTRTVYDINGIWNFRLGQHNPAENLPSTEVMAVPTSFNDVIVDKEKRQYIGDFWYERTVQLPPIAENDELVLRFGSVTHQASVYVNGVLLGEHKGGFTPFEFVIPEEMLLTDCIKISICANNELNYTTLPVGNYIEEVQEDGSIQKKVLENFDFFNYAGIHRPVKLYTRPKKHITDITVVSRLSDDLKVAYLEAAVSTSKTVEEVMITLLDEKGQEVGQFQDGRLTLENPHLWEVLNAYLYTVRVCLYHQGQLVDVYDEKFGIRSVEVYNGQFFINKKPFHFKGFGKHEDSYINGRGLNEAANLMDLNLLKEIGANSFRTSHYPYSEEMMQLADSLGIVVIDEVPAVGLFQNFTAALDLIGKDAQVKNTWDVMRTNEAHEQVITELIERDKNHPSVVMWVVANEPASHEKGARAYFEPLIQQMKQLDPQKRPVTLVNIMMATPDKDEVMDLVDVICLNRYYGWYVEHGHLGKGAIGLQAELEKW